MRGADGRTYSEHSRSPSYRPFTPTAGSNLPRRLKEPPSPLYPTLYEDATFSTAIKEHLLKERHEDEVQAGGEDKDMIDD